MQIQKPKFIDSEFFVLEAGNWHLKKNAPKEIVEEFNEFMKLMNQQDKETKKK